MKKHRMPDIKEGGVNVTPLIDIIMCLIIFFMLVAKIGVSTGINKDVDAPTSYLGIKLPDMSNVLALNLYSKVGTDEPKETPGRDEVPAPGGAQGHEEGPGREVQGGDQRGQGHAVRPDPVDPPTMRPGRRVEHRVRDQEADAGRRGEMRVTSWSRTPLRVAVKRGSLQLESVIP
jgi:hypothetical protein